MTYSGMFDEIECMQELKKLKKELAKLKKDKERGDADLEKRIDILQTDNDIKDYEIRVLREQIDESENEIIIKNK
jgi:Na+/phosphate symporter|tara:strand:- start:153 stop:377 length:225 start_codon:yes stop_codon:yes gene_type:complete